MYYFLNNLLIVFVGLVWFFFGGMDSQVKSEMQRVENQVAVDAVAQLILLIQRVSPWMRMLLRDWFLPLTYKRRMRRIIRNGKPLKRIRQEGLD